MYLFYDNLFGLKELINDERLYQTSENVNTIYVYVDNEIFDWENATITYEIDGVIQTPVDIVYNGMEEKKIPYDRNRDLKFFKYGKDYNFIKFNIPSSILAHSGVVRATIKLINGNAIQPLSMALFTIENEIVVSEQEINHSQYNYLLMQLTSKSPLYIHDFYLPSQFSGNIRFWSIKETPYSSWNDLAKDWINGKASFIGGKTYESSSSSQRPIISMYFNNNQDTTLKVIRLNSSQSGSSIISDVEITYFGGDVVSLLKEEE